MEIDDIISKYLNKTSTEEENIVLLDWLEENPENKRRFKKSYDLWLYANAALTDNDKMEVALSNFKKRIVSSENKTSNSLPKRRLYILGIAASILFLLSFGYIGYLLNDQTNQTILVYNQLITGEDGKGKYQLPDGSTVWLNANTVLKYPQTFSKGKRVVFLEGEALFDIKKETKSSFWVETNGLNIEVTGTRFLVRNYPLKNTVEAMLDHGKIQISGDYTKSPFALKPGELFRYNKQTKQTHLDQVVTDNYMNWIHSKLVFNSTNLRDIIINLEKWFGVEIVASQELTQKIHMSFTIRRESLEEVLKYMSLTAPIEYKWQNGVLYLYSKP